MKTETVIKGLKSSLAILIILLIGAACHKDDASIIEYSATGLYGDNILLKDKTMYTNTQNSMQSKVGSGKTVKIVITGKTYSISGPGPTGIWRFDIATITNWSASTFDFSAGTQSFTSVNSGLTCDLKIIFDKGIYQIDYYENNATSATATKTVTVNN